VEVGELYHHLDTLVVRLESLDEYRTSKQPILGRAGGSALAKGRLQAQRTFQSARHQLEQGKQVGTTESAPEDSAQPPGKVAVQRVTHERLQLRRRIATTLSGSQRRGLDGHDGLVDLELVDARVRGVDDQVDAHLMDDPGGLDIRRHGHEAHLAQVDYVTPRMPATVLTTLHHQRQRARVKRMSSNRKLQAKLSPSCE
jgi:hypothetical protein